MKQLLILSGKGGTGKTTVAGAFIKLMKARAYADCDVDAPNLHLISTQKKEPLTKEYFGLPKAALDQEKCISCDKCYQHCRFDAIIKKEGKYFIDYYACEGCGVCEFVCPSKAIVLQDAVIGHNMLYKGEQVFSTAKLKMGSGNSGKLVSEVKNLLIEHASANFAIIDGSPGIGCPVIASLSGADIVLIVAEPSVSGISDMQRIIEAAQSFNPLIAVCINKYDTNIKLSEEIKEYCSANKIDFWGMIPFDKHAVKAVNENKTIVDFECSSGAAVKKIFIKAVQQLEGVQV